MHTSSRLFRLLFSPLLLSLLLYSGGAPAAERVVTMGWESWLPYQYHDEEGKLIGLDVELAQAIFSHAGYELKFEEVPWKRHLAMIEAGKLDIAFSAAKNEEREKYAYFSDIYLEDYNVLFVMKSELENFGYQNLNEMVGSGFRIGANRGWSYSDEYSRLLKEDPVFKAQVDEVTSDDQNIGKLLKGRIDGFLGSEISGLALIRKMELEEKIAIAMKVNAPGDGASYIMLGKKSFTPEEVTQINSSLDAIIKEGLYAKIVGRYKLSQ
ncbi:MAG: amino acid ABC transporter substrate-binding protein [Gammaproteobacteria bacterium]|nr:amino acid ABC transporter substrate-binding protein [Gammaproteobacteria bacterium]